MTDTSTKDFETALAELETIVKTLEEGEMVEFEVAPGRKGKQAVNVIRMGS